MAAGVDELNVLILWDKSSPGSSERLGRFGFCQKITSNSIIMFI